MPSGRPDTEELASALDLILPPRYLHATRQVSDKANYLLPGEKNAAKNMTGVRLKEFTTSRFLIRELLNVINPMASNDGIEILPDADGVPQWPTGFTGCISHSKGICSVVVGKQTALNQSIGIDIEMLGRLSDSAKRRICSQAEQERIEAFAGASKLESQHLYTLIFSAKEAYFKYLFPKTRQWLEFLDVELRNINENYLELESKKPAPADSPPANRNVAYKFTHNLVATAVWG